MTQTITESLEQLNKLAKHGAKRYEDGIRVGRLEREDEMRETCQKACDESVMLRDKLNNQARSQELIRKESRAELLALGEEFVQDEKYKNMTARELLDCLEWRAELSKDHLKLQGEVKNQK